MKRVLSILTCAVLLLSLSSCESKISDEVKPIVLNATTQGFVGLGAETYATWLNSDKISLLSSEDWSIALLNIASGAGSNDAQFTGEARGSACYYAVRPNTALTSVNNGVLNITVEPHNIILSNGDTHDDLPQLGIGDKNGLFFSHLLGALQFNLPCDCTMSNISVVSKTNGLYGSYAYDTAADRLSPVDVVDNLTIQLSEPMNLTVLDAIFVAVPAASEVTVELNMTDVESGVLYSCTANNVKVERGRVRTIDASLMSVLPIAVGDWHLVSFCGTPASVDLYLSIAKDRSFTLYQRSGSLDYSVFTGTWEYDTATKTLSGRYSSGTAWASSYKVSLTESGELMLTNVNNSNEVSLYERAATPQVGTSAARASVDIKPFL